MEITPQAGKVKREYSSPCDSVESSPCEFKQGKVGLSLFLCEGSHDKVILSYVRLKKHYLICTLSHQLSNCLLHHSFFVLSTASSAAEFLSEGEVEEIKALLHLAPLCGQTPLC